MGELRKDYFTDRLVIIPDDKDYPLSELQPKADETAKACPYCPGNEDMTPMAELVLVPKKGTLLKLSDGEGEYVRDWCIRVFPARPAAVIPEAVAKYGEGMLYSEPARGYHYILIATPNHGETFYSMPIEQWVNVLTTIQDRIRWLSGLKEVSYVSVFLNQGKEAGAVVEHSHLHLITIPRLPPNVERESAAVQRSLRELGVCPMCTVVSTESGGPRQILSTDHFVSFSPWASPHAFEYWIAPKKHETSLLKTTQREIRDLALALRSTLGGLSAALKKPPFGLVFHTSPEKKATRQLHWHIEVYPHTVWTSLEHGMGIFVNPVAPEQAAEILGKASRKELASLIGVSD